MCASGRESQPLTRNASERGWEGASREAGARTTDRPRGTRPRAGEAKATPNPAAVTEKGQSQSAHVGTRKMVSYARGG